MKNPPILIAVLGFFAALAGFGHLFFGIQLLGFDWFGALGDLPVFEGVGLWGWLAVATGIVWLLVAAGLWALQPWARALRSSWQPSCSSRPLSRSSISQARASASRWRSCPPSSSGT